MMLDLAIREGTIVLPEGQFLADVGIADGHIVGIYKAGTCPKASRDVNAGGHLVMPGGVDPHVHFDTPFMGTETRHSFYTGTVSAAHGGVTTVMDFAIQRNASLMETILARRAQADGRVAVDYSLHAVPTRATSNLADEIKGVIEYGVPSLKAFMVYRKEGWMMDDAGLFVLLRACAEYGGLAGVHAENDAIAEYNKEQLVAQGKTSAPYHAIAKPNLVEAEAVNRSVYLATQLGAALYIFHTAAGEAVDIVQDARRAGYPIYGETCTHYLTTTREVYEEPLGHRMILSPPLRDKADQDRMWRGLADGTVSTTGSDDSAYDTDAKDNLAKGNFVNTPNGCPGCEFRLPVIWSEGVGKGRLTPERFVAITSTNAAKIMGLYPKKGTIAIGSDADVVVWDPEKSMVIGDKTLHMLAGWSPIEGLEVKGYPVMTISKGKVIVEGGEFTGSAGDGVFLKRAIARNVLTGPVA
jgi:dihydropyrimidinase